MGGSAGIKFDTVGMGVKGRTGVPSGNGNGWDKGGDFGGTVTKEISVKKGKVTDSSPMGERR